jgi:hypothetical protein
MLIRLARLRPSLILNCGFPMKRKLDHFSPLPTASPTKKIHTMATTPHFPTITLNAREQQLKTLLLDAAKFIDDHDEPTKSSRDPLVLRWAGGWVRDKLLGISSHDIDTAINAMTGEAFVDALRDYCDVEAHRARHALQPDDIGRLHTVPRNPDKSKHLATSTIKLCGLDVDFVNLRKETYAEDSRNPVVEFGTAEEDALRRDASVNALFYNLHTGEVEDFTGGLEDLGRGLIRTPMEPLQTFLDDPLRVLRLVRFASRLGFRIEEEAERVMADERVLGILRIKISRERIGVELEKMLKGGFSSSKLFHCGDGQRELTVLQAHSPASLYASSTGLGSTTLCLRIPGVLICPGRTQQPGRRPTSVWRCSRRLKRPAPSTICLSRARKRGTMPGRSQPSPPGNSYRTTRP